MGTSIYLEIPDEVNESDVIEAYYEYIVDKLGQIRPEWKPASIDDYVLYQITMERYVEEDVFYVAEQLSSTVIDHMDWETVRALFELDEGWHDTVICDREKIRSLIETVRQAARELEECFPDRNWRDSLEIQSIALCEFALENDYCIGLSLG